MLKGLAVAIAVAVIVAVRLVDGDTTERSARPTPTATPTPDAIAFFSGSIRDKPDLRYSVLIVPIDRQRVLKLVKPPKGRRRAADPSLGTAVLYRPGSEATARWVGRILGIETKRPLTDADLDKLYFDASELRAVVVFGEDALDHFFADPKTCQRTGGIDGGELTLCNPPAINGMASSTSAGGRSRSSRSARWATGRGPRCRRTARRSWPVVGGVRGSAGGADPGLQWQATAGDAGRVAGQGLDHRRACDRGDTRQPVRRRSPARQPIS